MRVTVLSNALTKKLIRLKNKAITSLKILKHRNSRNTTDTYQHLLSSAVKGNVISGRFTCQLVYAYQNHGKQCSEHKTARFVSGSGKKKEKSNRLKKAQEGNWGWGGRE